jgi:hypothetical protein
VFALLLLVHMNFSIEKNTATPMHAMSPWWSLHLESKPLEISFFRFNSLMKLQVAVSVRIAGSVRSGRFRIQEHFPVRLQLGHRMTSRRVGSGNQIDKT